LSGYYLLSLAVRRKNDLRTTETTIARHSEDRQKVHDFDFVSVRQMLVANRMEDGRRVVAPASVRKRTHDETR
jgi:hypothetical protein